MSVAQTAKTIIRTGDALIQSHALPQLHLSADDRGFERRRRPSVRAAAGLRLCAAMTSSPEFELER